MRITVTKKDIDNGIPTSSKHCPIAIAVKRKLKTRVDVDNGFVVAEGCAFALSKPARNFIHAFDGMNIVALKRYAPYTFILKQV